MKVKRTKLDILKAAAWRQFSIHKLRGDAERTEAMRKVLVTLYSKPTS